MADPPSVVTSSPRICAVDVLRRRWVGADICSFVAVRTYLWFPQDRLKTDTVPQRTRGFIQCRAGRLRIPEGVLD